MEAPHSFISEQMKKEIVHGDDVVLNQEETPCKRDIMVLNNFNKQGGRNALKQSSIYADDDEDRSLKYYKLGKSA